MAGTLRMLDVAPSLERFGSSATVLVSRIISRPFGSKEWFKSH